MNAPPHIVALLGKDVRVTGPHSEWIGRLVAYAHDPSVIVDTGIGRVCLPASFQVEAAEIAPAQPETPQAEAIADAARIEAAASVLERRYPHDRSDVLARVLSELHAVARSWRRMAGEAAGRG